LHALEALGCLKSRRKAVNGRTRVYYTATAAGKKRLGTMVGEWQRITDAVAGIVMGGKHVAV
jgi:PadR family transcriptional regulator PadR